MSEQNIVNIAGYKFIQLDDLVGLKQTLLDVCVKLGIKGSILIAPEGTNQYVSGSREAIDEYYAFLKQDPRFADMTFKESLSDSQPFRRMLVKLKKETITIADEQLHPDTCTNQRVSPEQLKQWYEDQEDFVILDTRNDFEMKFGSFDKAEDLHLTKFSEFPEAIEKLPEQWKQKPVVIFCTGGIRCEKAAPAMERAGFENVYQLEGGILNYFAKCGGAHYHGDCFVFDDRIAVDPNLEQVEKFDQELIDITRTGIVHRRDPVSVAKTEQ